MIRCRLCHGTFVVISRTHLAAAHQTSIADYNRRFGTRLTGFPVNIGTLPPSDLRYRRWRSSLKKRPPPWNTGHTKESHPSVAKISETFRRKNIDNFAAWRKSAIARGLLRKSYPPLRKDADLAVLIGLVLGDGNLQKFPRTETLRLYLGTDKPALIKYAVKLVRGAFDKQPRIYRHGKSNCMVVRIYQNKISERLGVPLGSRRVAPIALPKWVWRRRSYLIACLKGLFEAEGSYSVHPPTYTYNFSFSNRNPSLLSEVERALRRLKFHPERRVNAVRLRRRREVLAFRQLIFFRKYR